MLKGINWIAVIVAVVLLEALGFLWYDQLFAKPWLAALGHAPDTSRMAMKLSMGVVNTLITVVGLAWLIRRLDARSLPAALGAALLAWLFFDFTTMEIEYLYVGQADMLVLINMGYQLASYLLAAVVLGMLRPKSTQASASSPGP